MGIKKRTDLSRSQKSNTFDLDYKLIMDIGGGSTEFIIANAEGVQWKKVIN